MDRAADRIAGGEIRRGRDTGTAGLARPDHRELELAKWLAREVGEDKADQVVAFTHMCFVVPLDSKIALAAAEICSEHKLATADAIVYATALEYEADLLTCDADFGELPGVMLVSKSGA